MASTATLTSLEAAQARFDALMQTREREYRRLAKIPLPELRALAARQYRLDVFRGPTRKTDLIYGILDSQYPTDFALRQIKRLRADGATS